MGTHIDLARKRNDAMKKNPSPTKTALLLTALVVWAVPTLMLVACQQHGSETELTQFQMDAKTALKRTGRAINSALPANPHRSSKRCGGIIGSGCGGCGSCGSGGGGSLLDFSQFFSGGWDWSSGPLDNTFMYANSNEEQRFALKLLKLIPHTRQNKPIYAALLIQGLIRLSSRNPLATLGFRNQDRGSQNINSWLLNFTEPGQFDSGDDFNDIWSEFGTRGYIKRNLVYKR